ncbi:hypothetical protein MTP99_015854 [Tenebrio molitor]|nr:hypothetical protein MTP99_015854 [Tenebrio molitor]
MPTNICNTSFRASATCPRKPNSSQNAPVLTNFLSVLNSQPNYKLRNSQVICKKPRSWLVLNFVKNFFFCN